jgi:transcription elongation factor Elf1
LDWNKQQERIEDAQQMFLNPDLSITKNTYKSAKQQFKTEFDMIVLCPFCLSSYELGKFPLRKGLRVCPKCGLSLKTSTLTEITNLDRFVKFVFDYRFNGFWDKICTDIPLINKDSRFNEWNKRIYCLGLSQEFWEKYKTLKGDNYEI